MRHAVLGGGAIGGLLAAALARAGEEVLLLLRASSLGGYDGRLSVESVVLGNFEVQVPAAGVLDRPVDVLWVATKATQLESALELAPPDSVGDAAVVALLNGTDHLPLLRARYKNVGAAAIRVESERVAPGLIQQKSPFLRIDVAGASVVQGALRAAGLECRAGESERVVLWEKLVFLAPIALATTAADAPLGSVRESELFRGCRYEAWNAAVAEGAELDLGSIAALHEGAPAAMQSSMQKDVSAGREPELDAIAGPISRSGLDHGFPTPSTNQLVAQIRRRLQ